MKWVRTWKAWLSAIFNTEKVWCVSIAAEVGLGIQLNLVRPTSDGQASLQMNLTLILHRSLRTCHIFKHSNTLALCRWGFEHSANRSGLACGNCGHRLSGTATALAVMPCLVREGTRQLTMHRLSNAISKRRMLRIDF